MISFVIPVFNEEKNIEPLFLEIMTVMKQLKEQYEVIFVNDGSKDETQKEIVKLNKKYPMVRWIEFRVQSGKAAALHEGFHAAKGDIVFTLDGDLQDDPHEIPNFLKKLSEGYDMVSGWKRERKDSFIKNNTSKLFNAATNAISLVKLHDFNCGFKVYRKIALDRMNLYGELHRYIPVLVAANGFSVTEIPVHHRKRHSGKSKYGPIRFIHGALDLATVLFITKFKKRPLHLFGYLGIFFFSLGFLIALYLSFMRLVYGQPIGDRPLLLLAVLMIIVGVQVWITGLISEHIATTMHQHELRPSIKSIQE